MNRFNGGIAMNINKLKIGQRVKTINTLVESYEVVNVLKSVVWLKLENVIFKGIKSSIIISIIRGEKNDVY